MSYSFHPAAEAEFLESIAYYESKRPGLGAGFLAAFEQTMEAICLTPHRYRVEKRPDIHRFRNKPVSLFGSLPRGP